MDRRIKIISGGQSGVDRAALDVALELGIECGGWCPRGRKAEDGAIAFKYPLKETPSSKYSQRTTWNVRDSEGTLIVCQGPLSGGTLLTRQIADNLKRPVILLDLNLKEEEKDPIPDWLRKNRIHTLNVAGPRESSVPGIYSRTVALLRRALDS